MSKHRHRQVRQIGTGFPGWLGSQWKRLPENFRWNIEDTFLPEDIAERLLPGEEPQLEIRLAGYRDILGHLVFNFFIWVLVITIIAAVSTAVYLIRNGTDLNRALLYALIPFVILIVVASIAMQERIEYNQWRLVKTNARFIISIPQPGSRFLVDNIELKGMPNVIDTNWSRNPVWRVFQFFTGARDLYISLAAYRFVEGTARVGDALIIPDVMPNDVFELRKLVFVVPKS
ncbi:MAG: hypothetical protein P8183_10175 [Anaerolineae bacterium]|jgi:hypothetical protein